MNTLVKILIVSMLVVLGYILFVLIATGLFALLVTVFG